MPHTDPFRMPDTTPIERTTLGAVDIGSNAVRLLVEYVERYGPRQTEFKRAAYLRVPVRLGEDVFAHGTVGPAKAELLAQTCEAFIRLMRVYRVEAFRACATSALREATNRQAILAGIEARSGLDLKIISGIEEAELICSAEWDAQQIAGRRLFYMDVGGGSCEVTVFDGRVRTASRSFPLGTVRILMQGWDEGEMNRFRRWIRKQAAEYRPEAIVATGGNINKAQKMLGRREGRAIPVARIEALYDRLRGMTLRERMEIERLNASRADVIVPALRLFVEAARHSGVRAFIVPSVGLVDGIVRTLYRSLTPLRDF